MNIKYMLIFLFCFVAKISMASAQDETPDNIRINAEDLLINRATQEAKYTGEVLLRFKDLLLKTNALDITYKVQNGKYTISTIIIPTKLIAKKTTINDEELLIADSAIYHVDKEELILKGNVILQSHGNILKTDQLIYYTVLQTID